MAFLFVYYSSASGSEWFIGKSFGRLEIAPTRNGQLYAIRTKGNFY